MITDHPAPYVDLPAVSPAQRDALFAAVCIHDTIDLDAVLPESMTLDYDAATFVRGYALARAVWIDGADRRALARIAMAAATGRPLRDRDAAAFKDIRARYKQLRFATVLFREGHDYPAALHRITRVMGHLQDALRHRRRVRAAMRAATLRLLTLPAPFARIRRDVDRFRPGDTASFRAYVGRERATIVGALATAEITGKHFHETRKVVSRLVALFDCIDTLEPTPGHHATVRYLSTINGLMGALHDDMVARRMDGTQDYHGETFVLTDAVATRLRRLERALAAA